jgi:hypothetical protein
LLTRVRLATVNTASGKIASQINNARLRAC